LFLSARDLKVENILMGPDGLWKLCDFGSTSTNHKRFEKADEMGLEEDNIRKYTTPAYRAPEVLPFSMQFSRSPVCAHSLLLSGFCH
jgi:serine/threonine protein kinase